MKWISKTTSQLLILSALFNFTFSAQGENPSESLAQIQAGLRQAQADEAAAKARYQETRNNSKKLRDKYGPPVDKLKAELNTTRKTMTGTQSVEETQKVIAKVNKLEADLAAAEKAWKRQAVPARKFETDAAWDLNRANAKRLDLEKQLTKAQAAVPPATPPPSSPTPQPTQKPIVPAKPSPSASVSPTAAEASPTPTAVASASPSATPGTTATPSASSSNTPAKTSPTPTAMASAAPSVSEPPIEPDGKGKIIVPDMSVFEGIPQMTGVAHNVGLVIKFAAATPDSKDQEFKFAGQFPRAGSDADKGDVLVVSFYQKFDDGSSPSPNDQAKVPDEIGEMPNLSGKTVEQATARLPSNMSIGAVEMGDKPPKDHPERALTVYNQIPSAYSKIDPKKAISVTVIVYGEAPSGDTSPPVTDNSGSSPAPGDTGTPDATGSGSGGWVGTWGENGPNGLKISRAGSGYSLIGSLTDGKPVPGKEQGGSLVFSWELDLRDVVGMGFIVPAEKMGKKEDSTMSAKYTFTHNGDKLDMVMETKEPDGKVTRIPVNALPRVGN